MSSTYGSDAITLIVLQPDMVYANLWALCHSYSFRSVILFFHEGVVDPAWRVDHHGDCFSASFAMGLSPRFEGATPFTFSLSKPRLFLFLQVEAAQSEPYVVF